MRHFLLTLAFAPLAACGVCVTTTPLNESPRSLHSRPLSEVAIYEGNVPSSTLAVTLINVDPQGTTMAVNDLLPTAKEKAAGLGCDGLVIGSAAGPAQPGGYNFICVIKRE